ncbi:MAG: NAD-dependent epimerase/dehydratase family protein [Vicinamibacterales bacterium]
MRVLVTGGTGYLGTAIVAALERRRHEPVVFARKPAPGINAIAGDVTDAAGLARAARDTDAICHSAALVSIWERDRRRFHDVNVGGLRHAIAAARSAGHDRFVYTSSFLALPPRGASAPIRGNDYQRTKAEAARVADEAARAGFPITRLYPGVIYGPSTARSPEQITKSPDHQITKSAVRQSDLVGRLIRDQIAHAMPVMVGGDRIWSFAWIDDVAEAHVAALERGGADALMLGGENLPQRRLYEIVRDETGARVPRELPAAIARIAGAVETGRAWLTGRPPILTPATVAIFEHDWPLDSTAAENALNYSVTPLVEGVRRLLT